MQILKMYHHVSQGIRWPLHLISIPEYISEYLVQFSFQIDFIVQGKIYFNLPCLSTMKLVIGKSQYIYSLLFELFCDIFFKKIKMKLSFQN